MLPSVAAVTVAAGCRAILKHETIAARLHHRDKRIAIAGAAANHHARDRRAVALVGIGQAQEAARKPQHCRAIGSEAKLN